MPETLTKSNISCPYCSTEFPNKPSLQNHIVDTKYCFIQTCIDRAKYDPLWLVENGLLTIKTKDGAKKKFILNSTQKRVLKLIKGKIKLGKPIRLWLLKARQMGISTLIEAIIFAYTSQAQGVNACVLADDLKGSNYIFEMEKLFYDDLEGYLKPQVKHSNEKKLAFKTDSQVLIDTAENKNAGHKYTFQYLHLSEIARFPYGIEVIMKGLMQAVPNLPGTMVIGETTANGFNEFRDRWNEAKDGKSEWEALFLPWHEHEEYKMALAGGVLYPIDGMKFKTVTEKERFLIEEKDLKKRFNLTDEQINWRRFYIVNYCNGVVKDFYEQYPSCISGDTLVSSNPIGILEIKNVIPDNKITHLYRNGIAETFKLRTINGRELIATEKHNIHLPDGAFKELKDLKIGDKISLKEPYFAKKKFIIKWNDMPICNSKIVIDKKLARLLGYFMGDGSLYGDTLSFACYKDFDVIEDIKNLVQRCFGIIPQTRETGKKQGNSFEVRCSSKKITEILDKLGATKRYDNTKRIGAKRRKVCVPECILQSPKNVIREFLMGVFESDGWIGFKSTCIVLFSKHEKFLRDIQFLLLGFGINSNIKITHNKINSYNRTYTGRRLTLKSEDTRKFRDEIGFISYRKKERFKRIPKKGWNCHKSEFVDEVENIIQNGKIEVYDMTVEPEHTYSANGILVHNSDSEAFISTGDGFFDKDGLALQEIIEPKAIGNIVKEEGEYVFREYDAGRFKVYEYPKKDEEYAIGGDTAEGLEHGDGSGWVVKNKKTKEVVCIYYHRIAPDEFAQDGIMLANYYNEAIIAPENKGYGYGVCQDIWKEYGNIYRNVKTKEGNDKETNELGFNTNRQTRGEMLMQANEEVKERSTKLNDRELIRQYQTFINIDGKAQAEKGKSDDLVIASSICSQVIKQYPFTRVAKYSKEEHSKETVTAGDLSNGGFGFAS